MFVSRTAQVRTWRMLMAATVVAALAALLVATSSAGAASIVAAAKNRPAVVISDATITEGNTGTATLSFQVKLSTPAKELSSVSFATADGTATAGSDYQAASGTIRFKRGERSKTINVAVVGDTLIESDETLTVRLSNPVRLKVAKATATGTIKNDDVAPRSGHYSGQTTQGKPISFDVAADVKSLDHFQTTLDLTCTEVPVVLRDRPFDLKERPLDLTSTWTFGFSAPFSGSDVSGNVALQGALSTSGPATGTVQIDVAVNVSGTTVHCSTGSVRWNASPT